MARELSEKGKIDYALVQRAIDNDDQTAFKTLMDKYYNSIFHMMNRMVNNRNDAEDLTLEAFAKAFKKLTSYTPDYAFSTWLFKIASNNCIDFIRKKKLHLLSLDSKMDKDNESSSYSHKISATGLDPEEKFIQLQKVGLMRKLITKLNHKYRLMIELRYFEELSYEEIAKELDIPLGTVKAQLFRAKEILFGLLQEPESTQYIDRRKKKKKKKKKTTEE